MLSSSFGLTPRETDVLRLVGSRYANAEIAERLGISKRTVESHMGALLRKLAVPDRPALIQSLRDAAPVSARADADARERVRLAAAQARVEAEHQRIAAHGAVKQLLATIATQRTAARQLDGVAARWHQPAHDRLPGGR